MNSQIVVLNVVLNYFFPLCCSYLFHFCLLGRHYLKIWLLRVLVYSFVLSLSLYFCSPFLFFFNPKGLEVRKWVGCINYSEVNELVWLAFSICVLSVLASFLQGARAERLLWIMCCVINRKVPEGQRLDWDLRPLESNLGWFTGCSTWGYILAMV